MIYVDTSVALAYLLAEGRKPSEAWWRQPLVASRLVEYETWNRLNERRLGSSYGERARALIGRLAMVELEPRVLARALEPFPTPVRPLDALHLATIEFLRGQNQDVELASYDVRLNTAAAALHLRVQVP